MDITGTIIWAGERRGGTSARTGNPWASQDFVVESRFMTPMSEQIQRVCFNVFGVDKLDELNLQIGDEVEVGYGVNAREFEGKWFNDVRAYKVVKVASAQAAAPQQAAQTVQPQQGAAPAAQPASQPAPANFPPEEQQSDLPF